MGHVLTRFEVLFVAFTLSMSAPAAAATLSYRAIDLGVYPGDEHSNATSINDRGDVVGNSFKTDPVSQQTVTRAVIWQKNGAPIDLGKLPAPYDQKATASDINANRSVVGTSTATDGTSRAFLWRHGRMTELGTLGGPSSSAVALNDFNQIVGWAETGSFFERRGRRIYIRHAVLWQYGTIVDLGTLGCSGTCPDQEYSFPTDINNSGEIIGASSSSSGTSFSFLWKDGRMRALIGLASGDQVETAGINLRGDVVGTDDTQNVPIIWRRGGASTSLSNVCQDLGPARDVNDFGAILGYAQDPTTLLFTPRVCYRKTLNVLPPVSPSWFDLFPSRMNNRGSVVGVGNFLSPSGTYGGTRAVLWVPKLDLTCD